MRLLSQGIWLKFFAGTILLCLVLFALWSSTALRSSSSLPVYTQPRAVTSVLATPSALETGVATPTPGYEQALNATAEAIARTLPTASPDPNLPPNKADTAQKIDLWGRAARTAVALYPPPPGLHSDVLTPFVDLTPLPTEPLRSAGAGVIYDNSVSPLFNKSLFITNKWWEIVGNNMIIVCAGRSFSDNMQGEILIATEDNTSHAIIAGPDLFITPLRVGAVRAVDAVGERLTLQADQGTLFYFDVPTRQWVASTGTPLPAPSVSPPPTVLP